MLCHLLIYNVVNDVPLSFSLNEENTAIYAREELQQRECEDQQVLTGRKLATERAVMTTSQHAGVASSIWTNKARSFAAAWWLSSNPLANTAQRAPTQRTMLTGPGKACMKGWRNVAVGWWGTAARCMVT